MARLGCAQTYGNFRRGRIISQMEAKMLKGVSLGGILASLVKMLAVSMLWQVAASAQVAPVQAAASAQDQTVAGCATGFRRLSRWSTFSANRAV